MQECPTGTEFSMHRIVDDNDKQNEDESNKMTVFAESKDIVEANEIDVCINNHISMCNILCSMDNSVQCAPLLFCNDYTFFPSPFQQLFPDYS